MRSQKRNAIFLLIILLTSVSVKAQIAYSPAVASLTESVSAVYIKLLLRQLTGDTTVTVNNQVTTIASRHYLTSGNSVAAQYIFDKFTEYGYSPEFQLFNGVRGVNVIAKKTGTLYPDKEYIICAHYDNMPSGQTAPGCDDNATGVVAVLEAARIFKTINPLYTVKFITWDEGKTGDAGSTFYAKKAAESDTKIMGVINLDMLGWDANKDNKYSISQNHASSLLAKEIISSTACYQPILKNNLITTSSSDHVSFWQNGYPAVMITEDFYDFNAFYQTVNDIIEKINFPYYTSLLKTSIAGFIALSMDHKVYLEHIPVISDNSVLPREVSLIVKTQQTIATGQNSPRLYYSLNDASFVSLMPVSISGDTVKFRIPGMPLGSIVRYYFALQDQAASMIITLPAGGRGISPPGTTQPGNLFMFQVDNIASANNCSANTPILIPDNSNTFDYINIAEKGDLLDLDVMVDITHPRDYELRLILISPDLQTITLSDRNGNEGDNYTQTIFDDQASVSIKDAVAPFTGYFRPEMPLSNFNNKPIKGKWQLRIVESGQENSGMLNNWCLHYTYKDDELSIEQEFYKKHDILGQSYPNPAVTIATIPYTLKQNSEVIIELYDITGKYIKTLVSGYKIKGEHLITFSVDDLDSGTYFYTLKSNNLISTGRLVRL